MTIIPCEEISRLLFYHIKKRGAILFKMKYLKNKTQIENSFSGLFTQTSVFYVETGSVKVQWYLHNLELPKIWLGEEFFKLALREKCPKMEFFLVCIFLYSDWIQANTDQKKLRIWTLFTQCWKIEALRASIETI